MRRHRIASAALAAIVLVGAGAVVAFSQPAARAATSPVTVTVNTRAGLATMPTTGLGINDAIWDSQLGTNAVSDLLGGAGVRMMRYPGGSYADIYHWQTHTADGGYVAPGTDFDTFMGSVRRVGAQPMIIANYGTGSPSEAAAWVRYANVTKSYGVKYWTIGNENYGNGHYGANWEADNHADKSPTGYATLVRDYADAMKAVDPTIKVGAVLTMPANWPDGITGAGDADTWNATVLSLAGPKIDFVDVHWYPGGGTAAESLSKSVHINDAMYLLRQQIARYAAANAARLGISFTELNVGVGQNTQPGALFLADVYSGLLENGVFTVQWWNVHNGIGTVSTVAGQVDYGDFGMLSSGTCLADGVTCEPPLNTPFAPYHALSLMNTFVRPGDQFVRAATDQPLVTAHAVAPAQRRSGRAPGEPGPGQQPSGDSRVRRLHGRRGRPHRLLVHQWCGFGDQCPEWNSHQPDAAAVLPERGPAAPGRNRRRAARSARAADRQRGHRPHRDDRLAGSHRRQPSHRQVRGLPAPRCHERATRRDPADIVHGQQSRARIALHGQRVGP